MAMVTSKSPKLVRLARKHPLWWLLPLILTRCWAVNAAVQSLKSNYLERVSAANAAAEGEEMTLRGGVVTDEPYGMAASAAGGPWFTGFVPDMLRRLEAFAAEDGYRLAIDLELANEETPGGYNTAFDLVASDCNTTANSLPRARCQRFDFIAGAYYVSPARSVRADLSPVFLRASMSTIKVVKEDPAARDFTTLAQAEDGGGVVCVQANALYPEVVMAKFPRAKYNLCASFLGCFEELREGKCDLYAGDDLALRYTTLKDRTLKMTGELIQSQYIVMPLHHDLDAAKSKLLNKWMYAAVVNGTLDELYFDYFDTKICPLGKSGENCELNCDPEHGRSDKFGECLCHSSKWTGEDCSVEVKEDLNLIPKGLKMTSYLLFGINAVACLICAIWLHWKRDAKQVKMSQPFFLKLVLLGCLISSSTICVLSQESSGSGPVPSCAAIPWLYSIGFSVTFGTFFAKIWRVYRLLKAAAQVQKLTITVKEAILHICAITSVDAIICTVWTIVSPLEWKRTVTSQDQFGAPLESQGYCYSEHWSAFASIIAVWHLVLLLLACALCYKSWHITTLLSEGKPLAMVMISNLQIFLISIPVLIIVGAQSGTSFFVRAGVIWINDFAVIAIIFGNLMHSVHMNLPTNLTLSSAVNAFVSGQGRRSELGPVTTQQTSNQGSAVNIQVSEKRGQDPSEE